MSETEPPAARPISLADLFGRPPEPDPGPPPPSPDELRAEGFAAGVAAAQAEAAEIAARMAETHALALRMADEAARALIESTAERLADLALVIARAVLAAEPAVPPALIGKLVADVLAEAPSGAQGRLRVHPDCLAAAEAHVPPGWTLIGDLALAPGTVVADLGAAAITAGLADRLETLAALFGEGR
ncbi:MAG: FliH/SctL family protein [Sphingomonadaceae bacterium]